MKNGEVVPATIAHHVEPHKGNEELFFHGALASSCKPCHDKIEQSIEKQGFDSGCDNSGTPVDPKHPWNE